MSTNVPTNVESYRSHYNESDLWSKLKRMVKKAGVKVVYTALLLFYILESTDVSTSDKVKIYGALGYFILPIDCIPDLIPVAGYSDDLGVLVWALKAVISNLTPEIKAKAKSKLQEWFSNLSDEEMISASDGTNV